MNNFTKVTAAIIIEEQKVLITQRHPGDTMGGKWEFPGGKIENGETPEACLRRELYEELGIITEVHNLYAVSKHAYPHLNIELLAYNVTIQSGQITLHTHQDYRWVAVGELNEIDFCEADKPIAEKLRANRKPTPTPPRRGKAGETPALPGGKRQARRLRSQVEKCRQENAGETPTLPGG